MFRPPFVYLTGLLLATLACPLSMPLAPLLGYPALVLIGAWLVALTLLGERDRPARDAATWALYLGLILILHGAVIGADTALAGAPPGEDQKRFGRVVAYLGAGLAACSAVAAYLLDRGRRPAGR